MVIICAIPSCSNTQRKSKHTFFKLPKDKFYCNAWLKLCDKANKSLENVRVCSAHFRPECFKPRSASLEYIDRILNRTPRNVLKLNPTAIPTENISASESIIGEIEEEEGGGAVEDYLSETKNIFSNDDGSSEEINIAPDYVKGDDNSNTFDCELSYQFINNVPEKEMSLEISNINENHQNETLPQLNDNITDQIMIEDVSLERNRNVIDQIFSTLPDIDFITEEERENYLKYVYQIKEEINKKMLELQVDIEKKRIENEKHLKEIEILQAKRRKEYNHFLIQFLQVKKNKMFWKKKCLEYKIRLYKAKNKE